MDKKNKSGCRRRSQQQQQWPDAVTRPEPTTTSLSGRDIWRHADNKNSNGDGRRSFEVNNNKNSKPEKSERDAPATGRQQEQGPSGCTPGNNNKPPGEGMPSMPSWLDYCFEYEAVAARNVNKDNNMLA
ncbi:hypothetical protein FZZ93_13440 [Halomonas eurihalina]|uniref:Uncharacterized protein n=1 Tax=Halomonas eurihalina TaxID=42566 RepID=A0A5D9CYH9_HALER|nr:hypothetical protein [Halomonas eurihalina]MDR5861169.1 hypothetical protein [Halomonas eurihalina]TZG35521.1 hypothetical protein FZZ93_13440 [Halomonas eurihalina]